jgi:acetylglutamate kinase
MGNEAKKKEVSKDKMRNGGYALRVHTLIEALPYIRSFSGKIIVVKYGGSAMVDEELRGSIIQDISLLKFVGLLPVIVHGGGPAINTMLKRVGVESRFVNGLRVTDKETMEITEMVLAGLVNKDLVRLLRLQGLNAVGITGKDGNLFSAVKNTSSEEDLGLVGEITRVKPGIVRTLLENDFVPVVAPISMDDFGTTYNINADDAAVALAVSMKAEKLLFLTDVPGLLRTAGDPDSRISRISTGELEALMKDGTISGGMVPKTRCAVEAVRGGTKTVHIIDGNLPHSLLLEILSDEGVGTLVEEA